MSAEKNWQFELEEYIKQGEPGQIEKSEAWQTAIGLQAVDGLKTSAYLLDTVKEHFFEIQVRLSLAVSHICLLNGSHHVTMTSDKESKNVRRLTAKK